MVCVRVCVYAFEREREGEREGMCEYTWALKRKSGLRFKFSLQFRFSPEFRFGFRFLGDQSVDKLFFFVFLFCLRKIKRGRREEFF